MNLLERYSQFKTAKLFNNPNAKGVISINGYSFDIRLVNGMLYANGLQLQDFFDEAMLDVEEELLYEESIYNWLTELSKSQVA